MTVLTELLDHYLSQSGIMDAMQISDDVFSKLWNEERSVRTQSQSDYENEGFAEVSKRSQKVCLFVKYGCDIAKDAKVTMFDSDGNVIGMIPMDDEKEQYAECDNVAWLSKDFIIFTDIEPVGREKFVLSPFDMSALSDEVEGCQNPVGASPAAPVDHMLKDMAGIPAESNISTFIIGFDDR